MKVEPGIFVPLPVEVRRVFEEADTRRREQLAGILMNSRCRCAMDDVGAGIDDGIASFIDRR